MNILHIKYAVEVAKHGSLSKAAEELLIAQPNISRAIKELEADLGIDSIKRVEIFAEVLKKLAITLTHDQTEELSTLSTVEAIAAYLSALV